jgi:hypothetical protein
MTYEELQYSFETMEPIALAMMPENLIVAFARHMTNKIPPQLWIAKDWATSCGIIDQFRRTQSISAKQKMFLIGSCQRQLPQGLLYLQDC